MPTPARPQELLALHRTVDDHAPMVYRLAYRVLRNSSDAEDVVQDVFLKLLTIQHGEQAEAPRPGSLRSWLARVALNESLNVLRSEQSRRQRERRWSEERDRLGTTEEVVMEDHEAITQAVRALPPKLRLPILLHYQEGLKYREIAEALGCPEGTIARRISTAKARLKQGIGSGAAFAITPQLEGLRSAPDLEVPDGLLVRVHEVIDERWLAAATASGGAIAWTSKLIWVAVAIVIVSAWTWIQSPPSRDTSADGATTSSTTSELEGPSGDLGSAARDVPEPASTTSSASPPRAEGQDADPVSVGSSVPPALFGTITGPSGVPVRGALVSILGFESEESLATTRSNRDGYYQFTRLPAIPPPESAGAAAPPEGLSLGGRDGSSPFGAEVSVLRSGSPEGAPGQRRMQMGSPFPMLRIDVRKSGFVTIRTAPIGPPEDGSRERNFTLQIAVIIEGIVLDPDRIPVPGAEVSVVGRLGAFDHERFLTVSADDRGHFEFSRLGEGDYVIRARAEALSDGEVVAAAGDDDVVIDMGPGAVLETTIVDDVRQPLADVEVRVAQSGGSVAYQVTRPDGEARFAHLQPGTAEVQIYSGAMMLDRSTVELEAGAIRSHEVVMPSGLSVGGVVVGGEADAAESLTVRVASLELDSHPSKETRVESDGRFRFDALPPGRYSVVVLARRGGWSTQPLALAEWVLDDDHREFRVDLGDVQYGEIEVSAVAASGDALEWVVATLAGPGLPGLQQNVSRHTMTLRLPAGTYRLQLSAPGGSPMVIPELSVGAHERRVEQFTLPAAAEETAAEKSRKELSQFFPATGSLSFSSDVTLRTYLAWLDRIAEGGMRIDPALASATVLDVARVRPGPMLPSYSLVALLRKHGLRYEVRAGSLWIVPAERESEQP